MNGYTAVLVEQHKAEVWLTTSTLENPDAPHVAAFTRRDAVGLAWLLVKAAAYTLLPRRWRVTRK